MYRLSCLADIDIDMDMLIFLIAQNIIILKLSLKDEFILNNNNQRLIKFN